MNAVKSLLSRCLLVWLIFAGSLLAQTAVTPTIYHITETGLPGDVVGLQGNNFGAAPQVWLDSITASSGTPAPSLRLTQVISASDNNISVRIPGHLEPGLYALFVRNTDSGPFSLPAWVNRPAAWQALDLAGSAIDPNRVFRVTGRNLCFPGVPPAARFVAVSSGAALPATALSGSDQFTVWITAPAGLVSGEKYDLVLSNGYGGVQGEVTGLQLTGRAGGADPFQLNVPWAPDFTFAANVYDVKADARLTVKAKGDGVTNDAPVIQAAIDKANAAGGGVVYFPAGTYNVAGNNITMRSKVVLRGAGRDLSILWDNAGASKTGNLEGMFIPENRSWWLPGVCKLIGVIDLSIKTGGNGFRSTWKVGGQGPSFFNRVRMTNPLKAVLVYGTNNMLLQDSEIIHSAPNQKNVIDWADRQDVLVRNSYIEWSDGRVHMNNMRRLQLESTRWMRSVITDAAGVGYGGPALGGSSEVAIFGNTFGKIGEGKIPTNNDGETILNEAVTRIATGRVTGSTPLGMQDATRAWTANALLYNQVMIIQGPGMGQRRWVMGNDATSFTIDRPWEVAPTAQSYYTITNFDQHYLIKDNVLRDVPRGIWIYSCSIDQVAIVGNQLLDGDKIWLRADQRISEQRFNVQENILIERNLLRNTRNWYGAQVLIDQRFVDGAEQMGTAFYNVVVRDSRVEAHVPNSVTQGDGSWGEGFFSHSSPSKLADNDTPATIGTIFQRNSTLNVDYSYRVNTGSYQTVIWDAVAENGYGLFFDDTLGALGGAHGSVGTVTGWSRDEPTGPTLVRASSRRVHGDAGTYDIGLPLSGGIGIENRASADGSLTVVLEFDRPIISTAVSLTQGEAAFAEAPLCEGKMVTVKLSGVTNGQYLTVQLANVIAEGGDQLAAANVQFGVLAGDVDGNGVVDSADLEIVRANSSVRTVSLDNFRSDVTANGLITTSDSLCVRFMRPTRLP